MMQGKMLNVQGRLSNLQKTGKASEFLTASKYLVKFTKYPTDRASFMNRDKESQSIT